MSSRIPSRLSNDACEAIRAAVKFSHDHSSPTSEIRINLPAIPSTSPSWEAFLDDIERKSVMVDAYRELGWRIEMSPDGHLYGQKGLPIATAADSAEES